MSVKHFVLTTVTLTALCLSCGGGADKSGAKTEAAQAAQEATAEDLVDDVIDANDRSIFIPAGYQFVSEVRGDLNGDGIDDRVLVIGKMYDGCEGPCGVNPNSVIILLKKGDLYEVVLQKLEFLGRCVEEFEDYCTVVIDNGNLKFVPSDPDRRHGHSGVTYTFRYRDSDFELIGKDTHECFGDGECMVVNERTSVNYLTKRRKIETITVSRDEFFARNFENFRPRYNETWEDIIVTRLIKLSEINSLIGVTSWQPIAAHRNLVGNWISEYPLFLESAGEDIHITINISEDGTISISHYGTTVGKLVPNGENNFRITNVVYHIEGEEEPGGDSALEYVPESDRLRYGVHSYRRE